MATASLRAEVKELRARVGALVAPTVLDRIRDDPTHVLTAAGMTPDQWQRQLLEYMGDRMLLLCSRQAGKSQVAGALALREALLRPGSLVLLLSPTQRQSSELFKVAFLPLWHALGRPVPATQESALTMTLANGSRVVSLPGEEGTIRGYSGVRLLIIDEASRVPDALYYAVRPMLAVSGGRLIVASTPFGRRGFFWEAWSGKEPWHKVKITAGQCPRISPAFLAEERKAIGERWFKQEYLCEFLEAIGAVFSGEDIDRAIVPHVQPLEFHR
jgi:hypothetical protein